MKSVVIIFPGSNREHDVCMALRRATGREPARIWHREGSLPDADLIVLPGGFAYGDYLRCGAMAAHSPVMREVRERADRGTPVLGTSTAAIGTLNVTSEVRQESDHLYDRTRPHQT
jgi:phosphoribosylformylglycinamidine synthase